MKTNLTPLSYLIMSLLNREPQSGYALCRSIEQMPIGAISASPGSIYPCLKRLESSGTIVGKVVGGQVKTRRKYQLTPKGKRELRKWSREPFTAAQALRSPEMLFIKLSFLELDPEEFSEQMILLREDLSAKQDALKNYREQTEAYQQQGGKLAMDLAERMMKFLAEWSVSTEKTLRQTKKSG